jgi:hypothetical protein
MQVNNSAQPAIGIAASFTKIILSQATLARQAWPIPANGGTRSIAATKSIAAAKSVAATKSIAATKSPIDSAEF